MYSILLGGLINGVVGYFLVRWGWRRGFREGYMAGKTDSENAMVAALSRLLKPPNVK